MVSTIASSSFNFITGSGGKYCTACYGISSSGTTEASIPSGPSESIGTI